MKHVARLVMVAALGAAAAAGAQNPPSAPPPMGDSMRMPMGGGMMMRQGPPPDPEQLRMQVEERWSQMVQTELALTDQQMDRVRAAQRANQDRQRDLSRREEDLHRAVMGLLQPGVAANNDSLSRSLDALATLRVQHAQSDQMLLRDLGFLTPVQRARYFMMAQRFRQRLEQIRERSQPGQPGMAPGAPGMMRPMRPGARRPGMGMGPGEDDDM